MCYNVPIAKLDVTLHIYGEREVALALLSMPRNSTVVAQVNTAFGERVDVEWTDDGPITVQRAEKGLVVTEILVTAQPGVHTVCPLSVALIA